MRDFLKVFKVIVILFTLNIIGVYVSHEFHTWGKTNKTVHTIVMGADFIDFRVNSGGFTGASLNYFGWHYAKATMNPDRSRWHKILFWPNPYYLTDPPEEWPYYFEGENG